MKRRILVSAGDISGDLLLSKVVQHLREISEANNEEIEFVGLAGDKCQEQGVQLLAHSKEVAVVGISEVLSRLRTIFGVLHKLEKELLNCDSLICVDFPDFNFKLSKMARRLHKPIDYLVAPQLWAWRGGRVEDLKSFVRRVYPVLPFEETYLRNAGVDAHYLGHPLRDILPPRARKRAREELGIKDEDFLFAILPGSRKSEIKKHLSILIRAWSHFEIEARRRHMPQRFRALLPLSKDLNLDYLRSIVKSKDSEIFEELLASQRWRVVHESWLTMQAADFGWVASGTATLEAAYYQLPHILFYRLNAFSARMIRSLTPYFSDNLGMAGLPNILLNKRVIPEILQDDLTPERLSYETLEFLANPIRMNETRKQLRWIPKKLGEAGVSRRLAEDLWALWNPSAHS